MRAVPSLLLAAVFVSPAPAQTDAPRLLTGLSAKVGPDGVALAWTVDERRAGRIAGFTCVYRTPAHILFTAPGVIACGEGDSPPEARARTVARLPEYGEYLFEVVAQTKAGARIRWAERALQLTVAVTEDLAGAPGPDRAVTGAGPLIESCSPGEEDVSRPWRLDQIVSAEHLTHPPGLGWKPGGAGDAVPDWPRAPRMNELLGEMDTGEAFVRAAAGTKALLRPGPGGGHELSLHSSYPFGDVYLYRDAHAVSGWGAAGDPVLSPRLFSRRDCLPPHGPEATHDVALALTEAAGGGRKLRHAGYGWWTVAPVGLYPERLVAAKGGLSFGAPAEEAPAARAVWRGRASGHLFWDRRRWALAGDVELALAAGGGTPALTGRVVNIRLAPLDMKSLEPGPGEPSLGRTLALDAGVRSPGGAWSGALSVAADGAGLAGFPAPPAFLGDWQAGVHGPGAEEVAGRLRLWTPLADGADPAAEWPGQAVAVAGFGAVRAR